jgi:hypothetical protein
MKTKREQIIHELRLWFNSSNGITQFEHAADAILALQPEQKPDDYDIVNAAIDYSDEFGYSRKSVIELQEAYKAGARDFRDNNIHISKP